MNDLISCSLGAFRNTICVFTNMPSIRGAGDFNLFCIIPIDGIEIRDEHDE